MPQSTLSSIRKIEAKNGATTVNGIRLHSLYDPSREAKRFAESEKNRLTGQGISPPLIVITEPALSYAAEFLSALFPQATTCAVRYTDAFDSSNGLWQRVIHVQGKTAPAFAETLFSAFGEELLCAAAFLSWEASERAFPKESALAWGGIKIALEKSRDVLATREYFSFRWLKNAARFCGTAKKTARFSQGTSPVLIAASGPSLAGTIPFIKENREGFFLIALSSALPALAASGIEPEICVTTDGGFWAKEHLAFAGVSCRGTEPVFAASPESALPARVLAEGIILPLSYGGSSIESALLSLTGIQGVPAERNGTVAGTALSLARFLSTGPVFFCGLDLGGSPGFQHTRPNAREQRESASDTRLSPLAAREAGSCFEGAGSLGIYRRWFQTADLGAGVYRVSAVPYESSLGSAVDIRPEEYAALGSGPSVKPRLAGIDSHENRVSRIAEAVRADISRLKKGEAPALFSPRELFPAKYTRVLRSLHRDEEAAALNAAAAGRLENLLAFLRRLEAAP